MSYQDKYTPPAEIIHAAELVRGWAEQWGVKEWQISGCYSAPSAPLVAVSDNDKMPELPNPFHTEASTFGWPDLFTAAQMRDYGLKCRRASQVAPQARVEPLTDEQIDVIARPFGTFCVASGSSEFDHQGFSRAILATPPTSKANERTEQERDMCNKHGDVLQKIGTALGLLPGSNLHTDIIPAIHNLQDTSKADTGEQMHDDALEEAAKFFDLNDANMFWGGRVADSLRAMKSSIPSTIKAEPTGEQL